MAFQYVTILLKQTSDIFGNTLLIYTYTVNKVIFHKHVYTHTQNVITELATDRAADTLDCLVCFICFVRLQNEHRVNTFGLFSFTVGKMYLACC